MGSVVASDHLKARLFSLVIPACMDGMVYMVLAALPLLAIRKGADPLFLGLLGSSGQIVRLPVCLLSGSMSDRFGRRALILPSSIIATIACFVYVCASTKTQLVAINVVFMIAVGAYYPALEALVGDRSAPAQLRRNLAAFNIGWSLGGTALTLLTAYLLKLGANLPFYAGACLGIGVIVLSTIWSSRSAAAGKTAETEVENPASARVVVPNARLLLTVSRISMILAYAGIGAFRYLFPRLSVGMGFSESSTAAFQSFLIAGMGAAIIVAGMSSWWRGKFWPLIVCQGTMILAALAVWRATDYTLFAFSLLIWGLATGIVYTASIYYALHGREDMGKNAGIHESLTAAGPLLGSFGGGLLAQNLGERAPYLWLAGVSAAVILLVAAMSLRRSDE